MLLYSKDESGEWNLTGTAFTLPIQQFGEDHPEAFDGPLDNWHGPLQPLYRLSSHLSFDNCRGVQSRGRAVGAHLRMDDSRMGSG